MIRRSAFSGSRRCGRSRRIRRRRSLLRWRRSGCPGQWNCGRETPPPQSRKRQTTRLPTALVTTPESLCIMLASPEASRRFEKLRLVVCDEWHELMGSKRGVQAELALARLRGMRPGLRVWGVSATLGNLEEARDTLLAGEPGAIVHGVAGRADRDRLAVAHFDRAIPLGGTSRDTDGAAGGLRDRRGRDLPRLHEHEGRRRSSGSKSFSSRAPTGRRRWRCTTEVSLANGATRLRAV